MKDRFYGIGEPLVEREKDTGVPAERYLDLVEGLGCTALRSWMHLTDLLLDPHTPNEPVVASHRVLLERAAELDIEVTGMSHEWFLPEGVGPGKGHVLPRRDLRGSSDYMRTMHLLEESWCTMAGLFPEVSQWEVGNEWNNDIFLQPIGLDQGEPAFSPDEKMDIAVVVSYRDLPGVGLSALEGLSRAGDVLALCAVHLAAVIENLTAAAKDDSPALLPDITLIRVQLPGEGRAAVADHGGGDLCSAECVSYL